MNNINNININIKKGASKGVITKEFHSREKFDDKQLDGMIFKKHCFRYSDYGKFLGQIKDIVNPRPEIHISKEMNKLILREMFKFNIKGIMITKRNGHLYQIKYECEVIIALNHKHKRTFPYGIGTSK